MTKFYWQWIGDRDYADPQMTRARMARMMRAWRRDPNICLQRTGRGRYVVALEGAGRGAANIRIESQI